MADPTANLGYGKQSEATIDQANIAMRGMPWYQDLLKSWGQTGEVKLNDAQKKQVLQGAQANGFVVDESNMEVDDAGNFNPKGHKLRNTLIVAGIAAATIATMGAAGAFSGAAAGAGAGVEGASTAASLAGVEGGAFGLDAAAVSALGTGAMGATEVASAVAAGATVAADGGVWAADGTFIGSATDTTASTIAGSGLGAAGSVAGAGSTASKIASLLAAGGKGLGAASSAAGQNRLTQQQAGEVANSQNITGQSAFEAELMNRAKEEATQRTSANKDVFRNSLITNPRARSPFDPAGPPQYSDQYKTTEAALASQGATKLATPAAYDTSKMPALAPYTPVPLSGAPGTAPTTLEKIGNVASPALSVLGAVTKAAPTTAELIAQLFG